ncbi:hypothetical protein VINI7043_29295, partial [Vibrio nigripulchritudo ATCC 27043]
DARPLVDNDTEAIERKTDRVEIDLLVAQRAVGGEEQ